MTMYKNFDLFTKKVVAARKVLYGRRQKPDQILVFLQKSVFRSPKLALLRRERPLIATRKDVN